MVNCMYVNVWLIYAFSNTGCKMYNKYKDLLKKTWLWIDPIYQNFGNLRHSSCFQLAS